MLANTGPGWNSNCPVSWLKIVTPVTSEGSRSGVNWMRSPSASQRGGQRAGQRGLADAGHVLDQQVALGEQAHQCQFDGVPLALDDPLDVVAERVEALGEQRDGLRGGGGGGGSGGGGGGSGRGRLMVF